MIDVRSICQDHIGNGATVLVEPVCLEPNLLPIHEPRRGLFRSFAVRLSIFWTVDAIGPNVFRIIVV